MPYNYLVLRPMRYYDILLSLEGYDGGPDDAETFWGYFAYARSNKEASQLLQSHVYQQLIYSDLITQTTSHIQERIFKERLMITLNSVPQRTGNRSGPTKAASMFEF